MKLVEEYKGVKIKWLKDTGSYCIFEDLNHLINHSLKEPLSNGDIEDLLFELFEEESKLEQIDFDCEADNFGAHTKEVQLLKWLIDLIASITEDQIEEVFS